MIKKTETASELVTIAKYGNPILAEVAKSKLTSLDIYCFLANAELMSAPLLRTVIGEVELRVRREDVKRVRKILGLKNNP